MKKERIDTNSYAQGLPLGYTKWNYKYHIVFGPKYRRKVFFEEKHLEIREILRQFCQWKGVEIIEGEVCQDPYTHAGEYPAQNERFGVYGVFGKEKVRC